jgi:deoxyribonuclease-4
VLDGLRRARRDLTDAGFGDIRLCPETMGRDSQIGDLDAILRICEQDETYVPTIDFAHLHARGRGGLQAAEDFARILRRLVEVLGEARARGFHAHFCRIEHTEKHGEKRHRTFADTQFGPDFSLLAPLLADPKWAPTIICESDGTQAEDACAMRDMVMAARR